MPSSDADRADRTMSSATTYTQQPQYQPPPQPGYSAPYAESSPYPPQPSYGDGYKAGTAPTAPVVPQWYNEKNEEYGTAMQPKKKKFNDVIFLVLFLFTVRPRLGSRSFHFRSSSCARSPGSQSLAHSHYGRMHVKARQVTPV